LHQRARPLIGAFAKARLHEQDAQVTVAALRYLAKDGTVSGRYLPRQRSKLGGEVAAGDVSASRWIRFAALRSAARIDSPAPAAATTTAGGENI